MNQRIKELADEAAKFSAIMALPTGESGDNLFVEKFAELIVKECMDLVASRPYIDDGNWSHPSMMIKQHFGVEE